MYVSKDSVYITLVAILYMLAILHQAYVDVIEIIWLDNVICDEFL